MIVRSLPDVAPRIAFSVWNVTATVSTERPSVAGRRSILVTFPEKMIPAARTNCGNPNAPVGATGARGGAKTRPGKRTGGDSAGKRGIIRAPGLVLREEESWGSKNERGSEQTSTSPKHGETSNLSVCSEENRETSQAYDNRNLKSVTDVTTFPNFGVRLQIVPETVIPQMGIR